MTPTDPLLTESTTVDHYEFKPNPIKGYPELYWRGKRPFTSTVFYPAQHKETHGKSMEAPDGKEWRNKIFWGDNLQVMSHLLKEYRGKVDLIYIDPPYDSGADYKKKIERKGIQAASDSSAFEEKQYTDIWSNDEYLQFVYQRLILARELLSDNGSIFVHVDFRKTHHMKCMLDEIFGFDSVANEIIWCYTRPSRVSSYFPRVHDNIHWYSKSKNRTFNTDYIRIPYDSETLARSNRGAGEQSVMGTHQGEARLREGGKIPEDYWNIPMIQGNALERTEYPTQKPEKLLERIILAASNPDDLILDFFMGSGTTQAVAMKLGRRFIGADINLGAVQTTTKRLLKVAAELEQQQPKLGEESPTYYTGFEVYNVNNYDVFRNPLEAKDLLLDALEVNKFPAGNLFDGEKDGRLVKIMPVNRIATRADLNELITGFNYAEFDRRKAEHPSKAVERIMLVCMGHEPDLRAQLQKEVGDFKLDVEVVDILRDRQDLQFKRDSEAVIEVKDGQLVIKSFFPMNLLQKLSLQQENVTDWRELVESVMIDWNYDGAVISEPETDIPNRSGLVKGTYKVPASAANIRVKITDLLSESLEMDVVRG